MSNKTDSSGNECSRDQKSSYQKNKSQDPSKVTKKDIEEEDSDFVVTGDNELDEEDSITPEEDITDGQEVDSLLQLLARYGMSVEASQTITSDHKRSADSSNSEVNPRKRTRVLNSQQSAESVSIAPDEKSQVVEAKDLDVSSESSLSSALDDDNDEPRTSCKDLINENSGAYNSDEDEDYVPTATEKTWKTDVRIGPEYQLEVKDFDKNSDRSNNREFENKILNECNLLWDPSNLSESQTIKYERCYAEKIKAPLPNERTVDDEEALFLLMQCNYDVDEALNRLELGNSTKSHHFGNYISTWTEQDCQDFERGFALFYKDFRQIHLVKLKHKSVNEIVLFYYIWKKTARYDEFSKIHRKNKKKPVHPGLTDFMDCLTHEQDMIAESLMNISSEKMTKVMIPQKSGEDSCSPDNITNPTSSSSNDVNTADDSVKTDATDFYVPNTHPINTAAESNNNNNNSTGNISSTEKIQIKTILDSSEKSPQHHNSAPLII